MLWRIAVRFFLNLKKWSFLGILSRLPTSMDFFFENFNFFLSNLILISSKLIFGNRFKWKTLAFISKLPLNLQIFVELSTTLKWTCHPEPRINHLKSFHGNGNLSGVQSMSGRGNKKGKSSFPERSFTQKSAEFRGSKMYSNLVIPRKPSEILFLILRTIPFWTTTMP